MERISGEFQREYEMVDLLLAKLYQRCHELSLILGTVKVCVENFEGVYWTDGRGIYLDAERLCREFLQELTWPCQELLHMLGHCLLGHPFLRRPEGLTSQKRKEYETSLDWEAWELAERLWGEPIGKTTVVDCHESWNREQMLFERQMASGEGGVFGQRDGEEKDSLSKVDMASWWEAQRKQLESIEKRQKKVEKGSAKRSRSQRLIPASGHRGDYRAILKSFSVLREDPGLNQEEFQYSWYLYGMEHYDNMPLIEPLEYREERKIEELVIVIDTSGSCEKELVRVFLEETKGILEQEDLFFRNFCLHILQCDNQLQRDDKITSVRDFERYLEELTITGGGGTDFTPAFQKVEELKRAGEFQNLRGMLYFTDGSGIYPKQEPDYQVYFVLLKGHYDTIDTPDWVHTLVLEERSEI